MVPQKPIEKVAPIGDYQMLGGTLADFSSELAVGIVINNKQLAIADSPSLTSLFQLSCVEAAIAASADDGDVSEGNFI